MNEKLYLDTLKKYQKWAKENTKPIDVNCIYVNVEQ